MRGANGIFMTALEKAIAIAVKAHAGQTDKAGAPYVLHPLRLMLQMENETEMMAAVLHDVVEDGAGWTFERLAEEGIPATVIDAVDHLTKRPEDEKDYNGFIRRAATNAVARRVKLADLEDNMDLGRIANPTAKDFARLAKYRAAYATLASLSEAPPTPSAEASAAKIYD
jgi:(p)ppGpp synthase/HD superfamily hydrolase